jgi:hypothetical protein
LITLLIPAYPFGITNSILGFADKPITLATVNDASNAPDAPKEGAGSSAVRFASADEEIEPNQSLTIPDSAASQHRLSAGTEAQLREFSSSLQNVNLQTRRMSLFEPVSLPVSRVCTLQTPPPQEKYAITAFFLMRC